MSGRGFCLLFGLFLLLWDTALSQGFVYSSVDENIQVYNPNAYFGAGVSFYDVNKDGLDDLTFCIMGDSVVHFENTGTGFIRSEIIPNSADAKHPVWVDIDNDGDADLMVTKRNGGLSMYETTADGNYVSITSQLDKPNAPGAHSYGCAWADYDKDGLLDCYVANYNWNDGIVNWLFHNLGDGAFEEVAVSAGVDNGSRPSFQAVWIDYDQDSWPDLFVVNDKLTGNTLYRNEGDGTFQDVSVTTGAYQAMCAMSAGVTDHDRDGDFDIYISNFIFDNAFMQWNGGSYENIAGAAGLEVNAMCWGSQWIDYDNDSFEDLHVSTTSPTINNNQNYFYRNLGDGSYELTLGAGFINDDFNSYSSAKGDWNRDGFSDLVVTNTLNNTASLYTNQGIGLNSVTIGLTGTASNADAIGSLVNVYAGDLNLAHYIMCGENYLGQDSQYELFGIGDHDVVDSLVIVWPSGFTESFFDLPANQLHQFTEGETLQAQIIGTNGLVLCGEDTLLLTGGTWQEYAWSTGSTDESIAVTAPGTYSLVVSNSFGVTDTAWVTISWVQDPEWTVNAGNPSCFSESSGYAEISLINAEPSEITWSGIAEGMSPDSMVAGTYYFDLITTEGCHVNDSVVLIDPAPIEITSEVQHVSCYGFNDGQILVSASGGTGELTVQWGGLNPVQLIAGTYVVIVEDAHSCTANLNVEVIQPPQLVILDVIADTVCFGMAGQVSLSIGGGTEPYQTDWLGIDPQMVFQGNYNALVTDAEGCVLSIDYIVPGYSGIEATFLITDPDGGANGSVEIIPSGGLPPYEAFWSNGQETLSIGNLGQGVYACWITDAAGCSEMFEVTLIDVVVNETDAPVAGYPVFFTTTLNLVSYSNAGIQIFDLAGRMVFESRAPGVQVINTSAWPCGVYLMPGNRKLIRIPD